MNFKLIYIVAEVFLIEAKDINLLDNLNTPIEPNLIGQFMKQYQNSGSFFIQIINKDINMVTDENVFSTTVNIQCILAPF